MNEHEEVIEQLKGQLLIVFLKRLGYKITIPVSEIDDTGEDLFSFKVDLEKNFHFEIIKKTDILN